MTDLADRVEARAKEAGSLQKCQDYDADCFDIEDKVHCWLYDPCKGMCPFLSETEALRARSAS